MRHQVHIVPCQNPGLCSAGYPHAKSIKQDVQLFPHPKARGLGTFCCFCAKCMVLDFRLTAWESPKTKGETLDVILNFDFFYFLLLLNIQKTDTSYPLIDNCYHTNSIRSIKSPHLISLKYCMLTHSCLTSEYYKCLLRKSNSLL